MDNEDEEDRVDRAYKIILLGDSEVGKTSLINRYLRDNFIFETMKTIGVETYNKIIDVFNEKINLIFWDSSGQEINRGILTLFYRKAAAVVLIYDVTKRSSFESLKRWIEELERYSNVKDSIKIMIGNKIDLHREVSLDEGATFARKHNMAYLETSAKDNTNVANAFESIAVKISENRASLMLLLNETSPEDKSPTKPVRPITHNPSKIRRERKRGIMKRIFCFCTRDSTV